MTRLPAGAGSSALPRQRLQLSRRHLLPSRASLLVKLGISPACRLAKSEAHCAGGESADDYREQQQHEVLSAGEAHLMYIPEIAREITSCWISAVPSKMS
jgi:hypothetical protein